MKLLFTLKSYLFIFFIYLRLTSVISSDVDPSNQKSGNNLTGSEDQEQAQESQDQSGTDSTSLITTYTDPTSSDPSGTGVVSETSPGSENQQDSTQVKVQVVESLNKEENKRDSSTHLTSSNNKKQGQSHSEQSNQLNEFQTVKDLKTQDFEFMILSDTQLSNSNVNDKLELFRCSNGYAYLCLFKLGTKCVEFKYQNEVVWKHDADVLKQSYPASIHFKPVVKEAKVWFSSDRYYVYSYTDNKYYLKFSVTPESVDSSKPSFTSPEPSKVTPTEHVSFTGSDTTSTDQDKEVHESQDSDDSTTQLSSGEQDNSVSEGTENNQETDGGEGQKQEESGVTKEESEQESDGSGVTSTSVEGQEENEQESSATDNSQSSSTAPDTTSVVQENEQEGESEQDSTSTVTPGSQDSTTAEDSTLTSSTTVVESSEQNKQDHDESGSTPLSLNQPESTTVTSTEESTTDPSHSGSTQESTEQNKQEQEENKESSDPTGTTTTTSSDTETGGEGQKQEESDSSVTAGEDSTLTSSTTLVTPGTDSDGSQSSPTTTGEDGSSGATPVVTTSNQEPNKQEENESGPTPAFVTTTESDPTNPTPTVASTVTSVGAIDADGSGSGTVFSSSPTSTPAAPTTGRKRTPKSTETPKHPDKLKITTLESDGTTTKENDTTKYTLKQYDKIFKVEFNDDVKCTKVVSDANSIYQYQDDIHKGTYPKEVYYNSENNNAYAGIYKTVFIPRYGDEWKSESGQDKKFSGSLFKISIDGSTKENDNSKFDESQEGSFVKCQFKDDVKLIELKYDGKTVWKYEQSEHSGNHPKAFYFHKLIKLVFVEIEDNFFMLSRFDYDKDSWESEKLEKAQNYDSTKFKVVTSDSDGNKTDDDSSKIEKKTLGPIVYYVVKEDMNRFNFEYGGNVAFSFDKYNNKARFKGIFFLLDQNKAIICHDDKCFRLFKT